MEGLSCHPGEAADEVRRCTPPSTQRTPDGDGVPHDVDAEDFAMRLHLLVAPNRSRTERPGRRMATAISARNLSAGGSITSAPAFTAAVAHKSLSQCHSTAAIARQLPSDLLRRASEWA